MTPIRVYIAQPVVPRYRVPLFAELAAQPDLQVEVHASPTFPGAPASVTDLPSFACVKHPCIRLLGGAAMWQRHMRLPDHFRTGDVLIINGNPRIFSNAHLVWQARRRGVAVIWWGHGWSATSRPWRAAIRERLMKVADLILLYTDVEARNLRERVRLRRPVMAANNALDQRPIAAAMASWSEPQIAEFRRAHGLHQDFTLLFCGRLRAQPPSCDLDVALRAMPILLERNPDYRLIIIGDGEDGPRLRALSAQLKIDHAVTWLGPVYEESELTPWFLVASCFVYPGSIGLSLLHAFGYGLPVVTHSTARLHGPEFAALQEGINGLLFPRGDAVELARVVHEICTQHEMRLRMSRAASAAVAGTYSLSSMVEQFVAAIRQASALKLGRA